MSDDYPQVDLSRLIAEASRLRDIFERTRAPEDRLRYADALQRLQNAKRARDQVRGEL